MQKVIINPALGGEDTGIKVGNVFEKDYNLEISKAIYDNLKSLGIDAYLVRNEDKTLNDLERLNIINSYITDNDEVLVLTNMLGDGDDSGAEIIYALRNPDTLANILSTKIESTGQNILKYYQLRDPMNTSIDFYDVIKNTNSNTESIIVSYGYPVNDREFLENNLELLAQVIANGIYDYLKKESFYVVKEGDSLYQLALKFNTTPEKIKEVNYLGGNNLTPGQEILIPEEENNQNFFLYSVKNGDNLYEIARKYNTTINTLKEINNLKSDNLNVGETLKIPTEISTSDDSNYIIYTVKKGDSLYKIANQYKTTVMDIKNLNGLSSNNLDVGDILKIKK